MKIDLHIHSTASDGKLTPTQLIDLAVKRKVKAMAITDHDCIDGIAEALTYTRNKNIEFVPGCEFSANPQNLAKEIHIVGLFIQSNEKIKKLLARQREFKIITNKKMINRLNELGYDINFDELLTEGREIFGRPMIAELLLKRYPQFKDRKQVFTELLGSEGKAFFKNEASPMKDIIKTIHTAGGIAILAHPAYLFQNAQIVLDEFIKLGGDGLEVDCPYNTLEDAKEVRAKFRKIAQEKSLIISGGTDFHEEDKEFSLGSFGITDAEFRKMKERIQK